ncbi:MAG: 2-C-methyl-D-erythritol 4-phosphate cytidylyltransferase [Candidatus Dasytiphilus stammeri]
MSNTDNLPKIIAVVPAAGIGRRMQSKFPKQYLTIGTKTILEHAISTLIEQPLIKRIVIVLNSKDCWFNLLPIDNTRITTTITDSQTRADSVMAGLKAVSHESWVIIHDAVRPCLHPEDLHRLLSIITVSPVGGILATPVRDTIKRSQAGNHPPIVVSHTIERQNLWHALTPQLFPINLLLTCMQRAIQEGIMLTDEASALEYEGYHPAIIFGRHDNIKVTYPEDIALASFYLLQRHHKENT